MDIFDIICVLFVVLVLGLALYFTRHPEALVEVEKTVKDGEQDIAKKL